MIASGPFRGLFLFLGTAEFLHLIATRGASPQGPEKRLEFCEISHERGARSPANAPRDWTPPTHGTPPGGRRRGSTAPGGAAGRGGPGYPGTPPAGRLPRGGAAAQPPPGGAGYPGRRRAPCTGHVRGGYPRAATCPGRAATGQNRPLSGPHGAAGGAGYRAGRLPRWHIPPMPGQLPGGPGPGGGLPPGRRGGTATPGRALPPAATPGAAGGAMQRAVTGMRRHHGAGGY